MNSTATPNAHTCNGTSGADKAASSTGMQSARNTVKAEMPKAGGQFTAAVTAIFATMGQPAIAVSHTANLSPV